MLWHHLFVVALLSFLPYIDSIKCFVGYGERGLKSKHEIVWTRDCPSAAYCWEAVTKDITKVQQLIDYPWDSYYSEYFIRSCGGDMGTILDFHPYRGRPKYYRTTKGIIKLNVTTEHVVTGHGGTKQMDLLYICRRDLCSSASTIKSFSMLGILLIAVSSLWLLM